MKRTLSFLALILLTFGTAKLCNACTRVVYKDSTHSIMLTARSMDWKEDMYTKLWYFPKGMERTPIEEPNNFRWKSTYSSVVASAYNICSTDGINSEGLVANLLWLSESTLPSKDKKSTNLPGMPISALVQYVLDTYASVQEVVDNGLGVDSFEIFTTYLPNNPTKLAQLHLAISDASGDNAVFEFQNGKINIYHSDTSLVMANSPTYLDQLAVYHYWKQIDGNIFLPGTDKSEDRFARASYYTNNIVLSDTMHMIPKFNRPGRLLLDDVALSVSLSIIRDCSVPFGVKGLETKPNIASTLWRTVADSKNKIYYFESAIGYNTIHINLDRIIPDKFKNCGMYDPYDLKYNQNDITELLIEKTPFDFAGY